MNMVHNFLNVQWLMNRSTLESHLTGQKSWNLLKDVITERATPAHYHEVEEGGFFEIIGKVRTPEADEAVVLPSFQRYFSVCNPRACFSPWRFSIQTHTGGQCLYVYLYIQCIYSISVYHLSFHCCEVQ